MDCGTLSLTLDSHSLYTLGQPRPMFNTLDSHLWYTLSIYISFTCINVLMITLLFSAYCHIGRLNRFELTTRVPFFQLSYYNLIGLMPHHFKCYPHSIRMQTDNTLLATLRCGTYGGTVWCRTYFSVISLASDEDDHVGHRHQSSVYTIHSEIYAQTN